MDNLPKNIRYLRKRHNMTQEQLAILLDRKNFTTIQKWETGISEPSLGIVKKIADFFKVDIDDLITIDIEVSDSKSDKSRLSRRMMEYLKRLSPKDVDIISKLAYIGEDARDSIIHQIEYEYDKEKRKNEADSESSTAG